VVGRNKFTQGNVLVIPEGSSPSIRGVRKLVVEPFLVYDVRYAVRGNICILVCVYASCQKGAEVEQENRSRSGMHVEARNTATSNEQRLRHRHRHSSSFFVTGHFANRTTDK